MPEEKTACNSLSFPWNRNLPKIRGPENVSLSLSLSLSLAILKSHLSNIEAEAVLISKQVQNFDTCRLEKLIERFSDFLVLTVTLFRRPRHRSRKLLAEEARSGRTKARSVVQSMWGHFVWETLRRVYMRWM